MHIGRSVRILTQDATEWTRYLAEENDHDSLIRYGLIMIGVANIAQLMGMMLFALGSPVLSVTVPYFLEWLGIQLTIQIGLMFLVPKLILSLAPTRLGEKNKLGALKLYVYAMTPVWLGMMFTFIPFIGWLAAPAGGVYSTLLFYKHSQKGMNLPDDHPIGRGLVALVGSLAAAITGMLFIAGILTLLCIG